MKAIHVMIADDYALRRSGLRQELGRAGIEVVGDASDGIKALALVYTTGYLLKDEALEPIVSSIEVVQNSQAKIMQCITSGAIHKQNEMLIHPSKVEKAAQPLTSKENEVLRLMARGWSNKQIGKALFIEEPTVKKHVSQILAKMGVKKRIKAILRALVWGLISLEEIEQWVM